MQTSLIIDIVFIFVAALVCGFVAERFKQSPIVGYIAGGILVGPYASGIVSNLKLVSDLAEIGVILLMFTLGIEFSLSRLEKVRRVAIIGGVMQISLTILIAFIAGCSLGLSPYEAVFLGSALSMSSTMIVLRTLNDRGELNSAHGQITMGILIVQDLSVILMVSILPQVQHLSNIGLLSLLLSLGKTIIFVVVMLYLAQKVVPAFMERAAKSSSTDTFLILALSLGLGVAAISHYLGLSVSLGAFLAGLVISESDYAHEIMGKIISLRDAFVVLFFVSVGMMVNPQAVFSNWLMLLVVLIIIIPVKFLITFIIVRSLGYHSKISFFTAVGLAQTGEFSFVLAKLGLNENLISLALYNTILTSAIITILLTPWFIQISPLLYDRLRKFKVLRFLFPEPYPPENEDKPHRLQDHVILLGYGRVGHRIGIALQQLDIPFVAVDYDHTAVSELDQIGFPFIYGDASNNVVLKHTNPEKARLAILTLPDVFSNERVVRNLLRLNPKIAILARAHNNWERDVLQTAGATEVIQPETEAGLQLVRHTILILQPPEDQVEEYLNSLFIGDYQKVLGKSKYNRISKQNLKIREYITTELSPWASKSLKNSLIREQTGCSVVAIQKGDGKIIFNPRSHDEIELGNNVVVLGTSSQLQQFSRLNEGS